MDKETSLAPLSFTDAHVIGQISIIFPQLLLGQSTPQGRVLAEV